MQLPDSLATTAAQELLPFFVYGTLLPGQPNFHLWGDAITHTQSATLRGGHLYDLGNFPILVEGGEGLVHGQTVGVQAEQYGAVLAQLDALEGFDHSRPHGAIYQRVARYAYRPNGQPVRAWVYIGRPQLVLGLTPLTPGDWTRHSATKLAAMAQWWATLGRDLRNQPASFWTTFL